MSIVNILHVSVDGLWTSWGPWGSCSVSCGDGLKIRERNCSEPAPKFGGRECPGFINETQSCYSGAPCPSKLTTIYGSTYTPGSSIAQLKQLFNFISKYYNIITLVILLSLEQRIDHIYQASYLSFKLNTFLTNKTYNIVTNMS